MKTHFTRPSPASGVQQLRELPPFLVGACLLLLLGTGCWDSAPAPPPTVTITLPGGVTCSNQLGVSVTAVMVDDVGSGSKKLQATVCLTCGEAPLVGVSNVVGSLFNADGMAFVAPHPSLNPVRFPPTDARGCTAFTGPRHMPDLSGKSFKVTVVDAAGTKVSEGTAAVTD